MHLTITTQKAVLSNPQSRPEQKERARVALQEIPPKDQRYADAQSVLCELGLAKPEAVKPVSTKKKLASVTANAMFWPSMPEMQEAVDRYQVELEAEADRLADIMTRWTATKDDELLDSFAGAAPAFVAKSLDILNMNWEGVQFQLKIWANMKGAMATFPGVDPEAARRIEADTLKMADQEVIPVLQATTLITTIWPTIKRSLAGWNAMADKAQMNRVDFARLGIADRQRAVYKVTGKWPGAEWREAR